MGYNIALVDFELPEDFEEAREMVSPLTEQEVPEVEGVFKQFYDELVKQFPCRLNLPEDVDEDECVWADGPLIENFKVKAPVLAFLSSEVEEALPEVALLAAKMGLSVLDWQSGFVITPGNYREILGA